MPDAPVHIDTPMPDASADTNTPSLNASPSDGVNVTDFLVPLLDKVKLEEDVVDKKKSPSRAATKKSTSNKTVSGRVTKKTSPDKVALGRITKKTSPDKVTSVKGSNKKK